MKRKIQYKILGGWLLALAMYSCKQTLPTMFSEHDAVYFGSPNVFKAGSSSIEYSFAKFPRKTIDTLRIPISVLGNAAAADREFIVMPADSSIVNATPNVDYKLLSPYKVEANQFNATVPVIIYRTGKLDSTSYTFALKLVANQNFELGISAQTTVVVTVSYMQKPLTWDMVGTNVGWAVYPNNFGTWTKSKYKLVVDALYSPVADSSITSFPHDRFWTAPEYAQYRQIVRNYIIANYPGNYSTPLGVGATLRDPDAGNAVIQVAPANY